MKYEKLIKEINKELEFLKGEICLGSENGEENYYLYIKITYLLEMK